MNCKKPLRGKKGNRHVCGCLGCCLFFIASGKLYINPSNLFTDMLFENQTSSWAYFSFLFNIRRCRTFEKRSQYLWGIR